MSWKVDEDGNKHLPHRAFILPVVLSSSAFLILVVSVGFPLVAATALRGHKRAIQFLRDSSWQRLHVPTHWDERWKYWRVQSLGDSWYETALKSLVNQSSIQLLTSWLADIFMVGPQHTTVANCQRANLMAPCQPVRRSEACHRRRSMRSMRRRCCLRQGVRCQGSTDLDGTRGVTLPQTHKIIFLGRPLVFHIYVSVKTAKNFWGPDENLHSGRLWQIVLKFRNSIIDSNLSVLLYV